MLKQVNQWITAFSEADRATKWFIFNWALYGLIIVLTAVYCYARLDFVRSYEAPPPASKTLLQTETK